MKLLPPCAPLARRTLAAMLLCVGGAQAQTPEAAPPASQDKFALAAVVGAVSAGVSVFQAISSWFDARNAGAPPLPGTGPSTALGPAGVLPAPAGFAARSPSYNPAPLILGQPDIALRAAPGGVAASKAWDDKANYQGASVAAIMLDAHNGVLEIRSLARPFRIGERFKLRLQSTSDATLTVDQLNAVTGSNDAAGVLRTAPSWVRQLYPARADQVVQINAGDTVYLPLGSNEYFTFDGRHGTQLLALNLRARQAQAGVSLQPSLQPVYRQDAPGVTTYTQLALPGSALAMTQILALQVERQ